MCLTNKIRRIDMKKILITISLIFISLICSAQAQINTKKMKIADFTQKTTKVVLTGNDFVDSILKDNITTRWRVSPYEFCTLEEFESLKHSEEYYFLMIVTGKFKKESQPGLSFITLVKGGDKAKNGISKMLEIVSLPFASAENPTGREFVFLPVFLDIIQNHTLESMEKDVTGYGGLSGYTIQLQKVADMKIILSEDDLSSEIDEVFMAFHSDPGMIVTDEDSADEYIINNTDDTAVSYVVAPTDEQVGSFCYKMIIDSQTHELYYFRRHRITNKAGYGFLKEDIQRIYSHRER